jgi:hypothetical protein
MGSPSRKVTTDPAASGVLRGDEARTGAAKDVADESSFWACDPHYSFEETLWLLGWIVRTTLDSTYLRPEILQKEPLVLVQVARPTPSSPFARISQVDLASLQSCFHSSLVVHPLSFRRRLRSAPNELLLGIGSLPRRVIEFETTPGLALIPFPIHNRAVRALKK